MQALALTSIIGGTALSAYSTIQEGNAAAEAGKIQQQLYEIDRRTLESEAQAEITAASEAARMKRKEGRELEASQIAAISASGGGFVGSNLVVMVESARNVEMDALTIERNADTRAKSLRRQGMVAGYKGEVARYEGQVARRNARMRAFSGTLGTLGSMYLMYRTPGDKKKSLSRENKATLLKY